MITKIMFPDPSFARGEWLNLNGEWDFSFESPTYELAINVPYPWGSPLSGISDSHSGKGWYRRRVSWNPSGERIFIVFGAVDYDCEVFINGERVGAHRGGYSRFEFDITQLWNLVGENVIEVAATDRAERSQTYGKQGYGDARGIWQTVWLESRPEAYIESFFVRTSLDGRIRYEVELSSHSEGGTLLADFGGIKAQARVVDRRAELEFRLENPELWTPENPALYDGRLILTVNGGSDIVSTYFGIREIGSGVFGEHGNRYITLNGKPYFINGVLDQSFNPKGFFTLPSDGDCRDEILRLKRIGINMARIHIKAEEPLKLYYADRLGLLIMEDIPCFWGEPTEPVKEQFEREMEAQILRDRNHPSTFCWVIFNETWGLWTKVRKPDGSEGNAYLPETAKWVESCQRRAKELDPTRLVEDNSPCNRDHTVTDINTWHFYSNGYERVKKVVDDFCAGAYVGSQANYKQGYSMADVPCMNSECGNVWGVKNNAGDSDISWQYRYMINEFRLHDKLCGFVFTEFHDVVNEFNGFYKLDNGDKDFGYSEYGTSLRDLHSQDYLGADFAPMTTVRAGYLVNIPMFGSSFTDRRHGSVLDVVWELKLRDPIKGDVIADGGEYSIVWESWGTFPAGAIKLEIPEHDGIAELCWSLYDGGERIMSNCLLFDIEGERPDALEIEPKQLTSGFETTIPAIGGAKLSGLGAGEFSVPVKLADIPGYDDCSGLRVVFEASTREAMTHDLPTEVDQGKIDMNYMLGYRCDPGANRNSFPQTDENKNPGRLELLFNGERFAEILLPDCPADSRGALSHHYQPADDELDEAGSYGCLCDVNIPSRLLLGLESDSFRLTFRMVDDAGLSLFGRRSGRYGIGITVLAE